MPRSPSDTPLTPIFLPDIRRGAIKPGLMAPSVTINQAVGQADPTTDAVIDFDVVFSEPVFGFTNSDVVITGTTSAGTSVTVVDVGDHKHFSVGVTGMAGPGTIIADIPAAAANSLTTGMPSLVSTSTDNTVTYTGGPTVTINQGATQDDPVSYGPIIFDVVFSMSVTGFATGDVTLSGTAGATIADVTGSGANYTVSVHGMTGQGTVIATIAAGVATGGGFPNAASTSTDNVVTYTCLLGTPFSDPFTTADTTAAIDSLGACWDQSQGPANRYWHIASNRLVGTLGSSSQLSQFADAQHSLPGPDLTLEFDLIQMNGVFIQIQHIIRSGPTLGVDCYQLVMENGGFGGPNLEISINKIVAGVNTNIGFVSLSNLGSGGATPFQPGRVRFSAIGTTIKCDTKPLAGTYTNRLNITDGSVTTGSHVALQRYSNVPTNDIILDNVTIT